MPRSLLFLVILLGLAATAHAQSTATHPETGRPFLTCFKATDTGGGNQDWVFTQDQRGVLYVGDNLGVLEYDGATWRLITTATNNVVRAIDVDDAGRVFVGSAADFGYLVPDAAGEKQYVSLLDTVPEDERDFNDVWSLHATPEGIYFQARERIFRLRASADGTWQVKSWKPKGTFYFAFWLDGVYYVHQGDVGLMRMVGDALELLPGGEQFAGERLQVMLPFGDGTYLVGPWSGRLFRFDGKAFTPWVTEADGFLRANTLYKGAVLPGGHFGLGTLAGGYVEIDRDGRTVQVLDKTTGLPSNSIYAIFLDRSGLVWFSPENGICQYEAHSPLSRYDAASGLNGFVTDIIRHEDTLYLAAGDGVFYLDAGTFKPVPGLASGHQAWGFLEVDGVLLLAHSTGVARIEDGVVHPITQRVAGVSSPSVLLRSKQDPDRIFVGRSDALGVLRRVGETWIEDGSIPGITEEIRFIVEPEPGLLWLGSQTRGVLRVRFADATLKNPVIDRFGPEDGLPGAGGASVYEAAGQVVFAMKEGISRFDEATRRFVPDTLFADAVGLGGSAEEYSVVEDGQGNVWINFGAETAVLHRQADGSYRPEKTALLRFADEASQDIYPEADGVVWFGGTGSLIRYDPGIEKDYAVDYAALVRRVTVGDDSTLYGGAVAERQVQPRLRYGDNGLRFDYAATSYESPKAMRYASMLEGFDEHWSAWTRETQRTYTNLPPGSYTFRVKAKNIYEHESQEATFGFQILSPWYRTGWAYLLYVVLAAGLVVGLVRVRTHQLHERSLQLEQVVHERTQDIEKQKANVELLSEVGKEITASLDMDTIFVRLYENVNQLMDATIFGVGIYHPDRHQIEYRLAIAEGKRYAPYTRDTTDKNQFPVWCLDHHQPVFINDVAVEYSRYINAFEEIENVLEDGTIPQEPVSLIYLPLIAQDRVLGIITVQSYQKNAYTDYQLNILENLAAYTTVALDNADAYRRLNTTLEHLKTTQEQLVTQEKLASLGALTAGIAHEIKNPLNFVNNFADLNAELADELRQEIEANKDKRVEEVWSELSDMLTSLKINAGQIAKHGERANAIVKNMMEHASGSGSRRYEVGVNAFVEEYVTLAYRGKRAQIPELDLEVRRDYDAAAGNIAMAPQEMGRVLVNLLNNAIDAVQDKRDAGADYSPTVTVSTRRNGEAVEIRVHDNGPGIPGDFREKIFEPFFTTKPAGSGTGLGLSLSYDIVTQGHGGMLHVESEPGQGAAFVVSLPLGSPVASRSL